MRAVCLRALVLAVLSAGGAFAQSYEDLARNPAAYTGQVVNLQGKVVQVLQSETNYVLRVNVTPKTYGRLRDGVTTWTDTVYVAYSSTSTNEHRVLEGDVVNLRGRFAGIKSYTAIFGQTIQLPYIVACEVSDAKSTFRSVPGPC
jgi:hypothetical protein